MRTLRVVEGQAVLAQVALMVGIETSFGRSKMAPSAKVSWDRTSGINGTYGASEKHFRTETLFTIAGPLVVKVLRRQKLSRDCTLRNIFGTQKRVVVFSDEGLNKDQVISVPDMRVKFWLVGNLLLKRQCGRHSAEISGVYFLLSRDDEIFHLRGCP